MTKCGSASPKKWQHGCSAHSYCTCPSFPHFWTFPSCFTELGAAPWTEFVSFPTRERLHLPPRLPSTEVPDLAFFLFFFPLFCSGRSQNVAFNKNLSNINFFSFVLFLTHLNQAGEKKKPSRSENRCFKCTEQCLPGNEHSRQLLCFKRSPGCRLIMKQFSAERILLAFQITV